MNSSDIRPLSGADLQAVLSIWNRALLRDPISEGRFVGGILCDPDYQAAKRGSEIGVKYGVTVSLPPISRKRKVDYFPVDSEPVLIF